MTSHPKPYSWTDESRTRAIEILRRCSRMNGQQRYRRLLSEMFCRADAEGKLHVLPQGERPSRGQVDRLANKVVDSVKSELSCGEEWILRRQRLPQDRPAVERSKQLKTRRATQRHRLDHLVPDLSDAAIKAAQRAFPAIKGHSLTFAAPQRRPQDAAELGFQQIYEIDSFTVDVVLAAPRRVKKKPRTAKASPLLRGN
jgi:hypothetical protein